MQEVNFICKLLECCSIKCVVWINDVPCNYIYEI